MSEMGYDWQKTRRKWQEERKYTAANVVIGPVHTLYRLKNYSTSRDGKEIGWGKIKSTKDLLYNSSGAHDGLAFTVSPWYDFIPQFYIRRSCDPSTMSAKLTYSALQLDSSRASSSETRKLNGQKGPKTTSSLSTTDM